MGPNESAPGGTGAGISLSPISSRANSITQPGPGLFPLSLFDHKLDPYPKAVEFTWGELETVLGPEMVRETDCHPCPGGRECEAKNGPSWSPASYTGRRIVENVENVSALVADLDHLTDDQCQVLTALKGYRAIVHASHSDRPGDRCLRVVIPLDKPVPGSEWGQFWPAAIDRLGFTGIADPQCSNPNRIYYRPSRPKGADFENFTLEGKPFDVAAILATAPAPVEKSRELIPAVSVAEPRAGGIEDDDDVENDEDDLLSGLEVVDLYSTAENAAATLLARHWPAHGDGRHQLSLDLAGALAHAGWDEASIMVFIASLVAATPGGDSDFRKRREQARSSIAKIAAGEAVTGWPSVAKRIPPLVVRDACKWLGIDWQPDPVDISLPSPEPGSDAERVAQALADVRGALKNENKPGEVKLLFEPVESLFTKEYPPTLWLAEGLLTEGGTGIIGGEPKSIKTWIALEIAIGVATGTPVCGQFATGKPRRVAYFFAEDFDRSVRNRARALKVGRELEEGYLHVQPRGRFLDLLRDDDLAIIVASVRKIGDVELLILDPLRDLHSGQEDKSDDMAEVMRRLRAIETVAGCTVLACHHTAKASADTSKRRQGQRLRGSGAIHGSVDSGIYLSGGGGDGRTVFESDVTSEIKSARGAGRFGLTLTVEDDIAGEAVRASWKVSEVSGATGAGNDSVDAVGAILGALDDAIVKAPRGNTFVSFNAIKRLVGGGQEKVAAIVEDLEKQGLIKKNFRGKRHHGYVITAAGRREISPLSLVP